MWHKLIKDRYAKAAVALCFFNFLIRIPFANLPSISWDETFFLQAVHTIAQNGLNPFTEYFGYRPPAMFMLPAILFRFVYQSRIWSRLEIYLLSSIALYFTYLVGRKILSARLGLFTMILLFFLPLFTAESFIFQDSVPIAAAFMMMLYFYLSGNTGAYILAGSVLVLTKEPMIAFPFMLYFYDLFFTKSADSQVGRQWYERIVYLFPVLLFIDWALINKILLGWFFWENNVGYFFGDAVKRNIFSPRLPAYITRIYVNYGMWAVCTGIVLGFALVLLTVRKKVKHIPLFLFFILTFVAYSVVFEPIINPRYLLFAYPLLFFVLLWVTDLFSPALSGITTAVVILLFLSSNIFHAFYGEPAFSGDLDLSLFRHIYIRQNVIRSLNTYSTGYTLIDTGSMTSVIGDPFLGYTTKKFRTFNAKSPTTDAVSIRKQFGSALLIDDGLFYPPVKPSGEIRYVTTVYPDTPFNPEYHVTFYRIGEELLN